MKVLFSLVLVLAACIDQVEEQETVTATPKLAANALLPTQLLNTTLIPDVLDQTNLDEMSATADGRVTLGYVIGCALPAGTDVTGNYTDDLGQPATILYHGGIGLASSWTTSALSTAAQRLVTSCVLSLTNNTGNTVTVSLRGPNAALATTAPEVAGYTLREGAFFGNVFAGGEGPGACSSADSTIDGRVCAKANGSSTFCGYSYAGTCSSKCSLVNGYFVNCSWKTVTYTSPVTTYLTN